MTRRTTLFSLVVILLLALAIFGACGEKKADQGKEPATEVKADGQAGDPKIVAVNGDFDFGKVKQGAAVEHVFKIRNEGTADLKIEKARGS